MPAILRLLLMILCAGPLAAQQVGLSVVNAEIRPGPDGAWDLFGIVYNVGDAPVTLYGADGPGGEDGYLYATAGDAVAEIFEMALAPGNALDLLEGGLFVRFEDLDEAPESGATVYFYFDNFEMPVAVSVRR